MTAFVIDASTVLEWLLRDGRAKEADALMSRSNAEGAAAPRLMTLEVANGLRNRMRRGAFAPSERHAMLKDFVQLEIEWDDQADPQELTQLSDAHGVTIYGATYLALASRLGLPLATFDQRLAEAARAAGVRVLP